MRARANNTTWSAWVEAGNAAGIATLQTAVNTAQTTASNAQIAAQTAQTSAQLASTAAQSAHTTATAAQTAASEILTRFAQTAGSDTDANSVNHSRIFTANNATNHNLPSGLAQGVLLSMARNTTVNAQFYMPATNTVANNGRAFVRAKGASTAHSDWREITTHTHISNNQSGFIRFGNGLQLCWGRVSFASNQPQQNWTYPRAFSAVHNVQMTTESASFTASFSSVSLGTSAMTLRTSLPNAHACLLFAIGRADS